MVEPADEPQVRRGSKHFVAGTVLASVLGSQQALRLEELLAGGSSLLEVRRDTIEVPSGVHNDPGGDVDTLDRQTQPSQGVTQLGLHPVHESAVLRSHLPGASL